MANLFDVYNDGLLVDHTEGEKLETGETPISISGLTEDTTYDKVQVAYAGSYNKSDVPSFKTKPGRNYILNSKFSTAVDVPVLQQSVNPSFYSNKQVTASVYIKYDNVKTIGTIVGSFKRVVFAVSFRDASGKTRYLDAQKNITTIGESFAGRVSYTIDLSGFNVASMPTVAVFIQNFTADYVEASNPKLEIGNKATTWIPAPEDSVI